MDRDARPPNLQALYGLRGRTAIVTGAAAGIGRGIASWFAAAGAHVVIADRDSDGALRAAAELASGPEAVEALAVATDVSDERAVAALFDAASARFGGIDVLVNNAGITMKRSFPEVSVEDWNRIHDVNLRGVFLCMREAVRRMPGRGGSIVNVSSVSSVHVGAFGNSTYAAAKAGVNALTQSVALEYAPQGIRVNAVMPGRIDVARHRAVSAARSLGGPLTESGRIPLGRAGTPGDVAAAVLFLASPAAAYITGQLIAVDGGFLLS